MLAFYATTTLSFTVAMSLGAAALMASWVLQRPKMSVPRPYLGLTLGLIVACSVSLLAAKAWPYQEAGLAPEVHFFADAFKLWLLLIPLAVAGLLSKRSPKSQIQIIDLWVSVAAALGGLAVVQFFSGWPRAQPIPNWPGRFHATLFFGHHLSTASILIFPFFFALARRRYGAAAAIAVGLFLTWSRMLWLVLPVVFTFWATKQIPRRYRVRALVAWVAALGAFATAIYFTPPIRNRLTTAMGQKERAWLWETNLTFFRDRPILGIGWRKSQDAAQHHHLATEADKRRFIGHAHNNLLEMLAGTGILGTLAWVLWNLYLFTYAWRRSYGTSEGAGFAWAFFCAWTALHLNGLTQVNFWEGKVLHQMMWSTGLLFGLACIRDWAKQPSRRR